MPRKNEKNRDSLRARLGRPGAPRLVTSCIGKCMEPECDGLLDLYADWQPSGKEFYGHAYKGTCPKCGAEYQMVEPR